jgi:hypothetical protein
MNFVITPEFRVQKQGDVPPATANNNEDQWLRQPHRGPNGLLACGARFRIAPDASSKNPERFPVRAHVPNFNFANQLNRGASSSAHHPVEGGD